MSFYATEYTIHFDDTMAYGSHHFLAAFKFQCAVRETYLFGEQIFDVPGVKEVLDRVHLFTADAYSRNLGPAVLGDRLAILLTLEEWGRVSVRFCYRVLGSDGTPVCAGFQNIICADSDTGNPIAVPSPLWEAMRSMREIEERQSTESFRDRVLAGGSQTESLFGEVERRTAIQFLSNRQPPSGVISADGQATPRLTKPQSDLKDESDDDEVELEAWVFAGQGAFDAQLLNERVVAYLGQVPDARKRLDDCADVARQVLGGDAFSLVSGSAKRCAKAVQESPLLLQVGIHLQNMLGGILRQGAGGVPDLVMGHSLGEIAAMGVAGWFDLPTGVRIVCERARAIEDYGPQDGGLLVVSDCRHYVATEVQLVSSHQAVIAGRNHNRQTVVSGPKEHLGQLLEHFRAMGTNAVVIPSQTSFHHPSLRAASLSWRSKINSLELNVPSIPVFSPNGRRFISSHDNIVDILASQLLRPYDLQGAVADVAVLGVSTLVDCGSSGSLATILSRATPEGATIRVKMADATARSEDVNSTRLADAREIRNGRGSQLRKVSSRTAEASTVPHLPLVAIVAQGCILPAGAADPEKLYTAVLEQRLGIVDQRNLDSHWSEDFFSETLVPDRSTSHLTGHVNDSDITVPVGIDSTLFERFTRSQKLLCVALAPCIDAFQDADRVLCLIGATADGFEDQDTVASLEFAGIDPTDRDIDARLGTARKAGQTPHGAIQEVFDQIVRPGLEITLVDAACASSMYTVALGMLALESNRTDAVLAGGVFCPGPGNSCLFSQFQGTTSTGCRPFDRNADGVVFSEGSAIVVLRRLADAESLGLSVSAVVRGAGVSSDGRSSSANVPQSLGQLVALERCYEKYGIDPASIDAIEAHGTSTPVGDSTELKTLRQFFAGHSQSPIPVHSIKGLLGHAGWAAGTASVIVASQYLKTGVFPAQAGFQSPSDVLLEAKDTVFVPTDAVRLSNHGRRIAIDGFGFGGANAHLVLESYSKATDKQSSVRQTEDDELVFVAYHELAPTLATPSGMRFDRHEVRPPDGYILLPDLADDMDISQTLCVRLVDEVTSKIDPFDDSYRKATGIVLAQCGKTERGVEATMRVLTPRLKRALEGAEPYLAKVDHAYNNARPSGPYTLQCMMPNVSSGRAALYANLNGPNFVVDGGSKSLESAIQSASLLLTGNTGTNLVIVAAVSANSDRLPAGRGLVQEDEFAAAFGMTTRRHAESNELTIVADVDHVVDELRSQSESSRTSQKLRSVLRTLQSPSKQMPRHSVQSASETHGSLNLESPMIPESPIHTPVWIESPLLRQETREDRVSLTKVVAIVPADRTHVTQVLESLSRYSSQYMVVVVGPSSQDCASEFGSFPVFASEMLDEESAQAVLEHVDHFRPDIVMTIDFVSKWKPAAIHTEMVGHHAIHEFCFLVAKRNVQRMNGGEIELWGLLIEGWSGVPHPQSGPLAGLFKAIRREIPATRVGVICTRNLSLNDALLNLAHERSRGNKEAEIVYDGDTRLIRRLRQVTRDRSHGATKLDSNSVVVASGGGRGVTAVLLKRLLQDFGCTVVALGRSEVERGPDKQTRSGVEEQFYNSYARSHPKATVVEMKKVFEATQASWEAYETIEDLASSGNVEYLVADVTDRTQVTQVIDKVVSKYGKVDLVLHGAGVQYSKRLQDRSLAEFRRTFDVKVAGLLNLTTECYKQTGSNVDAHVLTSAYSIFGNDGQHDYGAANETLDRLCELQTSQGDSNWSSIAWLAWDGIGMTRGSEYRALAKQRGLAALNARDGSTIFSEVMSGRTSAAVNVPLSVSEHVSYAVKTVPSAKGRTKGRVLELPVDLSSEDCLRYHLVKGIQTLPGAWTLGLLVNAAMQLNNGDTPLAAVTVENATFNRFVQYREEVESNLRVVAEETPHGIVAWLIGDVSLPNGVTASRDAVFAEATLHLESEVPRLTPTIQQDDCRSVSGQFARDPFCDGHDAYVSLSGPFDCLREISIGPNGRSAKFCPESDYDLSGVIPSMAIDSALRLGAMYADDNEQLYVPVRIGRLVTAISRNENSSSTSGCCVRATAPVVEARSVTSARTEIVDERGNVILTIEDAVPVRVE
ncbi:SDR family oxidoreductase [Planctomycetota bacterium]